LSATGFRGWADAAASADRDAVGEPTGRCIVTTYADHRRFRVVVRSPAAASVHVLWLAAGLVLSFLVPYVLTDRLATPRDLYYAVYSAFAFGLFAAWAHFTGRSLRTLFGHRLLLAVGLGLAFACVMAAIVLGEPSGPRPGTLELAGALLWRGIVYGFADGILLSAFPILVVFAAFANTRLRRRVLGTVAIGAVALVASLGMTAAYHAGYSDFRSEKLRKPVAGDVLWSMPTLLTLNPIGAPIAHAGLHVAAVVHDYDTELFLPPHG
jgi:hypothetical protein